jgi:hypothetical protein
MTELLVNRLSPEALAELRQIIEISIREESQFDAIKRTLSQRPDLVSAMRKAVQ